MDNQVKFFTAEEVKVPRIVTRGYYTNDAIEELIQNDIRARGFDIDRISYDLKTTTKSDDWGMNPVKIITLEGVSVYLKDATT